MSTLSSNPIAQQLRDNAAVLLLPTSRPQQIPEAAIAGALQMAADEIERLQREQIDRDWLKRLYIELVNIATAPQGQSFPSWILNGKEFAELRRITQLPPDETRTALRCKRCGNRVMWADVQCDHCGGHPEQFIPAENGEGSL